MDEPGTTASAATAPPKTARRPRRRISPARKLLFIGIIFLSIAAGMELLARTYWTIQDLPFWSCPRKIQHVYYENLVDFESLMRKRGEEDRKVRVLILGASTVYPNVGAIPTILMERLTMALGRRVEIVDLAIPAHTTLDSLYKYQELGDKSFDLVLVYHGINELRANNCPPEMFREDYSHYQWYREVNAAMRGRERRVLALPVTLKLWAIRAGKAARLFDVIPEYAAIHPEWSKYGSDIKTAEPFYENMEKIVQLGRERGEKVVIMSYAHYLAPGYTLDLFDEGKLDYTAHWFAVEVWGEPLNIVRGIGVHNEQIRKLAAAYPDDTLYVDQEAGIPKKGRYFNDICHLTNAGCALFVENLLPAIVPHLERQLAADARP